MSSPCDIVSRVALVAALAGGSMLMGCSSQRGGPPEDESPRQSRPNFLVIVADDLGYSDLGVMGSEIRTPNLDRLAGEGLLLTNFHVAPNCSPTRAMLLTGVDTHPAGLGTMEGEQSPEQLGQPGYEGSLSSGVVSVATLLRDVGYHTYLSGKWHLGWERGDYPGDRGFERSFGPIRGGSTHFNDRLRLFFRGSERSTATFLNDGEVVERLPDDYFSSQGFTDRLIEQIESGRDSGRPFFAYAAYTAPHWPLQAPEEYIDRYVGVYDDGYDKLRAQRVAALRERAIVPTHTRIPDLVGWEAPWDSLSPDQRARSARTMEVYAAMVENLDHHVGRLVTYLKSINQYDNTVILFFSDNGAEGNLVNRIIPDHGWVEREFDNRLENIGRINSYVFPGAGWAQASTAPFRFYKAFPSEGGVRTPAIVRWSGASASGVSDTFASVKDVVPTLLELAETQHPAPRYQGRAVAPLEGASMVPLLRGDSDVIHNDTYVMGWELFGRRALRRGDWKILWVYAPYGESRWSLFNLENDPAESVDLAAKQPEKLAELLAAWDDYATRNQVVLPAQDAGYGRHDFRQ